MTHFQTLPFTRMTEELMDGKTSQETEDFKYYDPKLWKPNATIPKTTFQEAIVFVIGGGNYMEYQNLVDVCKVSIINVLCYSFLIIFNSLNLDF